MCPENVCVQILFLILFIIPHVTSLDIDCPPLDDANSLSQTQLIQSLTHVCRYDRLERPVPHNEGNRTKRLPVDVYARAYIYFMQNLEAHDLQFKIHALLQLRFLDARLNFQTVAPERQQPILGEKRLRDLLWIPHIFFANERDSSILGTSEKDILTSVSPDGTVIFSSRIQATLYCWMNLHKFPFDEQHCSTVLESWMYNTSELVLHWEQKRPITFDPALHMTEYLLASVWPNETVINADLNDLRHGAFAGNYSSLSFTVHLTREIGFYLMDYFLPSMLIVGISWVSFWLQADQAPPRITLGTSTMLTFITLASAQGKTLPKVSYIKVSEVWFFGCTFFIFGSLVEFAFVNTIWRRQRNVNVKKISGKHILRSTLSPALPRRQKPKGRSRSVSVMPGGRLDSMSIASDSEPKFNNYLTVHNFPITTINEGIPLRSYAASIASLNNATLPATSAENNNLENVKEQTIAIEPCDGDDASMGNAADVEANINTGWTMTSQEISMWIDEKARFVFPLAFLAFNAVFWIFVYFL